MTATPQAQRAARLMDGEIRRIELASLRAGNAAAIKLRAEVLRAWLRGGDPFAPIARFEKFLTGTLAEAMTTGYLQGRLRARATARRAVRKLSMARDLDAILEDFSDRLGLRPTDVESLARYFTEQATARVVDAGNLIRSKVADAAAEAIRRGDSVRTGAAAIREAMTASGVTPQNPYLAETLYRTSLQESYAAARWQANQAPEIQEILWGYEFAATIDDRTTDGCIELDGVRRPKNDALWLRQSPPRHWNCRSQLIEIFVDDEEAGSTPVPQVNLPESGFQENVGVVFRVPGAVLEVPAL